MKKPENIVSLKEILAKTEEGRYAVGSFSPRHTTTIRPILLGAQEMNSPVIVQISQREMTRYEVDPREFVQTVYSIVEEDKISVPIVIHLDHTKEFEIIQEAIEAGFTSVMIDASEKDLEENIRLSKRIVEYAAPRGVSVEAELGRIGTTDFIETDSDEEMYTVPEEAARFVDETHVDALAVSVGTAHGAYITRKPKIDYDRLKAIKAATPVHLVLHGGSGVPVEMVRKAVEMSDGGISKLNIATDIEEVMMETLNIEQPLTDAQSKALSKEDTARVEEAIKDLIIDRMSHYLNSKGHALDIQ